MASLDPNGGATHNEYHVEIKGGLGPVIGERPYVIQHFHPRKLVDWLFLWKHKSALLGVALLSGIALYPLFPLTVNLIAENQSNAPLVLILALIGISCFEIIPQVFSVVCGPWTGFFVGFVGVLLGGLLANALAAHDFPTKIQAWFDFTHGQPSRIGLLVWYSFLIGASAHFARRKTGGLLSMRGGVNLLIAIGLYLLSVVVFSQVELSFSVLYPLLAVSDQTQVAGNAIVWWVALCMPASLLLLVLPLLSRYTTHIHNWILAHKWGRYGAVLVILILLALPPGYEIRNMQTASTVLQNQTLAMDIPLTCASCAYPYFQMRLESIKSQNDESQWDITLINPGNGPCIAIAFLPQSIILTDAFFQVYQPTSFSGLDSQQTLHVDSGGAKTVSLFYQIVPRSGQHLQFTLSLHVAPCAGTGGASDEIQGSQMLLFQ